MARRRSEDPKLVWRNGVAYAQRYDAASRRTSRRSLHTRDRDEATARFAASLLAERGATRRDGPAGLTVDQALDDYHSERIVPSAVDPERVGYAMANLKRYFGDVLLADVDVRMCRAYAEDRRSGAVGRPSQDSTVRRELGVVTAAANHAVKWKRLSRDQLPVVEMPPAPPPKELWLFPDELAALQAAATGRARDFIAIAYDTAGRKTSIETLTVFQVSLARNRINLAKPGEKRTKKRRPVVPISPALRPVLAACLAATNNGYVLGHGGSVRKAFAAAAKAAGLEMLPERDGRPAGKLTPHVLRHTRATHLLQAGAAPWAVASLLGDTVDTVLRNYGHHCPGYLDEVLGKAEER